MTVDINKNPFANGHDHGSDRDEEKPRWSISQASKWALRDIPQPPWLMEEWVIRGQVTGLYGVGGVRKTDWLIQFMIAAALGKSFCGIPLPNVTVFGLFCEDTDDEIGRRLQRLCEGFYQTTLAFLDNLHYASLVGVPLTELITYDYGTPVPTAAFSLLESQVALHKPKLVVLDTASDFFGGRENERREVAQFVRLLDSMAQKYDCAIVFSAQPSVRGRDSKTFESGSTGWENKVRARLTLHDPQDDEEDEDDQPRRIKRPSDRRTLTRVKSNYAEQGVEIPLLIKDGGFFPANIDPGTAPLRGLDREIRCRSKFKELLDAITRDGRWVHDVRSAKDRYAPAVFAKHADHGIFNSRDFAKAMSWLLDKGQIRLGTHRHAGREYPALILTHPEGDNDAQLDGRDGAC